MMTSTHASLDAAATERKARLAKLASLKRKQPPTDEEEDQSRPATDDAADTTPADPTLKHLSLRNYDPETRGPKLGFEANPVALDQETLETRATQLAAEAKAQEEKEEKERTDGKGIDLFDLQPRKPNWDLKRDLARKMDVLQQRTDNAIARLVRERLEGQKKLEQAKSKHKANGDKGQNGSFVDTSGDEGGDVEGVGIAGVDLVEGIHVREKEEEQNRRRREDEDDEDDIG